MYSLGVKKEGKLLYMVEINYRGNNVSRCIVFLGGVIEG